ncbi:MAG: discoidin domain-containing protein [Candidatus Aminicenantaceae bacterium]
MQSRCFFVCLVVSILICIPGAMAQVVLDEDYVLIQARSVEGDGAYSNSLVLIIDGKSAPEAGLWNGERCVYWEDEAAFFILDLGAEFLVVDAVLQVDDDDIYTLEYSADGLNYLPWHVFYTGYGETGRGLDTMSTNPQDPDHVPVPEKDPLRARYIRLSASSGDRQYSLAELQIYGYALTEEEVEESRVVTPAAIQGFGEFSRDPALIIDGHTPAQGGMFDDDANVYWEDLEAYFVVDLGQVYEVIAIQIQVNVGGHYRIEHSLDDREYIPLVEVVGSVGDLSSGMDTLHTLPTDPEYGIDLDFFPAEARYLKIYVVEGEGPFAVSELQVYTKIATGR